MVASFVAMAFVLRFMVPLFLSHWGWPLVRWRLLPA